MMSSRYNLRSKSKQPHLILSLPKEILEVILNYISQEETLNLRLVCKAWNNDVQNLYNYEVKGLDENSRHFQRILGLRIQKLSLISLTKTNVLDSQGISIFRHPKVIRVLKLKKLSLSVSCISPKNLHQLLGLCAKNLQFINLRLRSQHLDYEFSAEEVLGGYTFSNLKYLRITYCGNSTYQAENSGLLQILENSSMPQLKELRMDFMNFPLSSGLSLETKNCRIGESILRILSRNGINLEILDLEIFYYEDDSDLEKLKVVTLQNEELDRIKQMGQFQRIKVMCKPFALQLQDFWQQVLANQKHLVSLSTWLFPGGPISIPLCQQIVKNNCATLVDITIWELNLLADDPPFDLSVFQACHNLEALVLIRTNVPRTDPEQPDVKQFHCLPESITELKLFRLKILSGELLMGFTQGFKNLRHLCVEKCGMHGLLGVNWPVLSAILITSRPSLTNVSLIKSINRDDQSIGIELGRLGLSLSNSDLCVLRTDYTVEPGHFDWVNRKDESDSDYSDSDDD